MKPILAGLAVLTLGACTLPPEQPGTPAPLHPPFYNPADPSTGAGGETEAILKAVDTFLLALGNGDRELQKSVELSDGMLAISRTRDGAFQPVRRMPASDFQKATPDHDPFIEVYWNPEVQIRGPFAQVWAPYELRDNGAVVHCGIDAFQMVKLDGAWKIHGMLSSMEAGACEELGATSGAKRRPLDGWKETPNQ